MGTHEEMAVTVRGVTRVHNPGKSSFCWLEKTVFFETSKQWRLLSRSMGAASKLLDKSQHSSFVKLFWNRKKYDGSGFHFKKKMMEVD